MKYRAATELIIIRGAPGVGKTSVVSMLRSKVAGGIFIETDTLRAMVNHVDWDDTRTHLNAVQASKTLAFAFLEMGYRPVFLIDTLSGGTLDIVIKDCPYEYRIISLVADEELIKTRIEKRKSNFMNVEKAAQVNRLILESDAAHNFTLNTTTRSIDDITDEVLGLL